MAEPSCTACASSPCACKSDIQNALETLDDLLSADGGLEALDIEDVDAVDDWANNIQLDIMRYRRLREGRRTVWQGGKAAHSPTDATTAVSAATEAHGGAGEAQEGSR